MINIRYPKVALQEFRQSPEAMVIVRFFDEFMEGIKDNLETLESSAGLKEADRTLRDPKLFPHETELSPSRKKLLGNIIGTLKGFPSGAPFYNVSQNTPDCLIPYFVTCVYNTIQTLSVGAVLKRITVSNGAYSLFNIVYEDTQTLNSMVMMGAESLTIKHDGKEYILGKDGIPVMDYYRGQISLDKRKPPEGWKTAADFKSKMNHHLKTNVAENIGISYFMRAFRVPSNQWKKAVVPLPLGTTAFPDFILDTVSFDDEVNDFMFKVIGTPRTRFVLVDVKAAINTGKSTNFGSVRLRYTFADSINNFLSRIGVLEKGQNLFDPAVSKKDFRPVPLSYEQFLDTIKFFINDLYGQPEEYAAGKAGKSSYSDVQKYLAGSSMTILYEEVGANTGTHPFIYATDIVPGLSYFLKKSTDNIYDIIKDGVVIAKLNFYNGQQAEKLSPEIRARIAKKPRKAGEVETNPEEIGGEDDIFFLDEPEDEDSPEFKTKADAIRKTMPVEDWMYMFKWNKAGLRQLKLPDFQPTYPRAVQ